MNFFALKALVKRNLGNRGEPDFDALVESWINNAHVDLVTTAKFPELGLFSPIEIPELDLTEEFSTADNMDKKAVPDGYLFSVSMRNSTKRYWLNPRGIRWLDRHRSTVNGQPRVYAYHGGYLHFDPTCDGTYVMQHRYRRSVAVPSLTAPEQVPIIGEEWHECIELAATYRGARSLKEPTAETWLRDWKDFIVRHHGLHFDIEEDSDVGFEPI